jgi:hypothetical protein
MVFTLDKATKPDLIVEDMARSRDGWPSGSSRTGLRLKEVKPIENALGDDVDLIQGMAAGTIAR